MIDKKFWTRSEFVIPLLVTIFGTLICYITDIDLWCAERFYDQQNGNWPLNNNPIIHYSYTFGPMIAAIIGFWSVGTLFLSYMNPRYFAKRAVSYFILLSLIIGPLLVTNGIVKEIVRRPRPREITQFGSNHEFRRVLTVKNWDFRGKSFPGGHASSGFILVFLYFLFKQKSRKMAGGLLLFSLAIGIWLSLVRMMQGGHFLSDQLWAFSVNWFVVYTIYYKWYLPYTEKIKEKKIFRATRIRYIIGSFFLVFCSILLLLRFIFSIPFDIEYPSQSIEIPSEVKELNLKIRVTKGNIYIVKGKPNEFKTQTWAIGDAFPGIQAKRDLKLQKLQDKWDISFHEEPTALFFEYQTHNYFWIPPNVEVNLDMKTIQGEVFRRNQE